MTDRDAEEKINQLTFDDLIFLVCHAIEIASEAEKRKDGPDPVSPARALAATRIIRAAMKRCAAATTDDLLDILSMPFNRN